MTETNDAIRVLGNLQKMEVKPGDFFVLTSKGPLSLEMRDRIQKAWVEFTRGDAEQFRLLILEKGMELGIISPPANFASERCEGENVSSVE